MAFTSLPMHLFRRTSMTFCCLQRTLQTLPQSGSNVNRFTERSHTCGELTQKDVGQRVELCGWVKHTRYNNKIIALHDSYGTIQCVVTFEKLLKSLRRATIHNESVIKVSGVVQSRPPNQVNAQMHSGAVEVLIDDLKVISGASKDLPILTRENIYDYTLINKLKYRYLDIRSKPMQEALRFRSKVSSILRQQLLELDFVECETPTLFRRTPGGANEFIVPTQMSNLFYGLTQSPQQLKQLLMIGGLDRYFQICRCYRDESGRTDRQPEFTQLDIEMSFTNQDMIIELVNWIIFRLLKNLKEKADFYVDLSAIFDADQQIRRMSYLEALMNYGCDKPDTRFGWLIRESESEKGLCIVVPFIVEDDLLVESLKTIQADKNVDVFKHVVKTELDFDKASTKIFINEQSNQARQILGQLRLLIANKLDSLGHKVYENNFRFIWITNFPLFEYNEKTHAFQSSHHPFTAPTEDTKHLLDTDPSQVIGNHYDLVLNGQEIGGGSIRIHDANLQRMIFSDILKLDDNTFEYFIEALNAGCPPHGGIALGLDRLVAILLNRDSIRDVIAFPKSNLGRDIMSGCPHEIDQDVKKMYHLGI